MSKRSKSFNNPFSKLKGVKIQAEDPPEEKAAPQPKASSDEAQTDAEIFAQAMTGTHPLGNTERIEPVKRTASALPDDDSLALEEFKNFATGDGPFDVQDTGEMLSGRAPGISLTILKRLQKGEFAFRSHIDLHGHTREQAHAAIGEFIANARRNDERCVLVVTGHGKSSPNGMSVLRETLPRWLSRAPVSTHVLCFCTAKRVDGGPGAFYVLLRKAGR